MYTKRESIRGESKNYWHCLIKVLKCQTGSWSLDPLAPVVPAQNLVQMFLDGKGEKKRRCRSRSSKKMAPPTAIFSSRHGNIQAALRAVGDSAGLSVATVHSKTRGGNIFFDLVGLKFLLHRNYCPDPSPRSLSPL
jgi:hypothetical protein